MKKIFTVLLAVGIILSSSACNGSTSDSSEKADTDTSRVQTDSKKTAEEQSKPTTASSSVNSPLSLDTWGIASKYCTKNQSYVNVPVKVTRIIRGGQAAKIVKEFTQKSKSYTYTEPEKDTEWAVAEYEIYLDGFPVDDGGADSSITSFISGLGGGNILKDGEPFGTVTLNITDGKYYYDGTVSGKIAYIIPKKSKDYVIAVGEYEETQTFFSEKALSENSS